MDCFSVHNIWTSLISLSLSVPFYLHICLCVFVAGRSRHHQHRPPGGRPDTVLVPRGPWGLGPAPGASFHPCPCPHRCHGNTRTQVRGVLVTATGFTHRLSTTLGVSRNAWRLLAGTRYDKVSGHVPVCCINHRRDNRHCYIDLFPCFIWV